MNNGHLLQLLPTMPMIVEELTLAGWTCRPGIADAEQVYRGIRLYHRQQNLQNDVLYLLHPAQTGFPTDQFSYISTVPLSGTANHFLVADHRDEEILDILLELFSRFQYWSQSIDQLIYRSGSLQELCELGEQLLENPVCIHDDWFIMTARSQSINQFMAPEYVASSSRGFIPRAILDDFQHDRDYLETYNHRSAQIWSPPDSPVASLYVNLWDGTVYRGRLLVIRGYRDFRKSDFILAEVLTQRAMFLLNRKQPGESSQSRSMDDIVYGLLQNRQPDPADLSQLLSMLSWSKSHRYLCVRIKNQQPNAPAVMDHVLHSDLFRTFAGSYIMFTGREQCLILNLTSQPQSPSVIRHQLAPLCRDYCLYAGISSPVSDIRDLHLAYYQADVALQQAFRLRSDKWIIPFSDCVLDYLSSHLDSPLQPVHLASPELALLREHDQAHGTQYFETLRAYLLLERDIPKTAQALIIHRTTLLYRLKKIQALIPANLDDPWYRLYLMLSLWILEKQPPSGS